MFCLFLIRWPLQLLGVNELVMGQDLAVDSASIGIAAAGAHAERLSNLVTSQRAVAVRHTGLGLYPGTNPGSAL